MSTISNGRYGRAICTVRIFAGSNTTGSVADCEGRKRLAFDERLDYLAASSFRFFAEADIGPS